MPTRENLPEFTVWCPKNITGNEEGQVQISLDRLLRGCGQSECLDEAVRNH
jgi:hypothetical protein